MAKKKKEPSISFKGFLAAFAIALGGGLVGFCFIAAAGAYMESQQKTADEPPAVSQTIRGTLPSSAPVYTSTPEPTAPPVEPSTEPEMEQISEPIQQTTTPTAAPTQAPTATQAPAPAQTKAPTPTPAPTASPAWNGGAVVTINPTIPPAQQTQAPAQSGGQSGSSTNGNNRNRPPSAQNLPGNTTVYVSNSANKIHSIHDCSGMRYYRTTTLDQANSNNYEYCSNCWG